MSVAWDTLAKEEKYPQVTASMKNAIKALAESISRFVLVSSTAFGIASYANWSHHQSYWNGTIQRVQTVDFNMLSHMLPTKLSQAMIEGDQQEIQRTLDSNYGLFGLVVTNCTTGQVECRQTIQYASNSDLPWRTQWSDDALADSTFDVLRDPPPLHATGSYSDSRDPSRDYTGLTNTGRIIGRVYYVRGIPPRFFASYTKWLRAWPESFLSNSGANRYYALTTTLFGIAGLSAWAFMELGLSKRQRQLAQAQRQQAQLELAQVSLLEEAQDLRQQLEEKLAENSQLIEERSRSLIELEAAQQRYQSQEVALKASFQKLKDRLAAQDQAHKEEEQRQTDLQLAIEQQQQAAQLLRKEIADLKSKDIAGDQGSQRATAKVAALTEEQAAKQRLIEEYTLELQQVWQELDVQTKEREEQARLSEILQEQIKESKRQQANASIQQEKFQNSLHQMEQERKRDKQRIKALEERLKDEKRQGDNLRTLVNDISQESLNFLEKKAMDALKSTAKVQSSAWLVHSQIDVSSPRANTASMFTDCIVIGNSFIAVIEAKNYSGKIHAEGGTRNSVWLCSEGQKGSIEIASCWGNNPYQQTSAYVRGAMQLLSENVSFVKRNTSNQVSVYGIIVFPDNADLSALDAELGRHYRVTRLCDLEDVLHELERQTQQIPVRKGIQRLSPADIEAGLLGRKSAKPVLRKAA
jgi:hypothetical protein